MNLNEKMIFFEKSDFISIRYQNMKGAITEVLQKIWKETMTIGPKSKRQVTVEQIIRTLEGKIFASYEIFNSI
jgi:hypothetical protein